MSPLPDRMSDHWWWRPGVRPGRRLLVWHRLPDGQPEVHDVVRQCQDKLAGTDDLDLIPAEWLHVHQLDDAPEWTPTSRSPTATATATPGR